MNYEERRARRAAIDAEIATHRTAIRSLEFERNTFVSLNLLPNEILSYILSLIASGPTKLKLAAATRTGLLGRDGSVLPPWLWASQVCVRWREVALGAAVLNRRINMAYSTQWTGETIKRASVDETESSLGFFARLARASSSAIRRFTTVLQHHHERMEQLELACGAAQDEILAGFFTEAAMGSTSHSTSLAEALIHSDIPLSPHHIHEDLFRFDILNRLDLRGPRGAFYSLPAKLATPVLPSLRHLYLYNVVLNSHFPSELLGQLSTLDLTYDVAHVGTLSLKSLVKHMAHASLVERLALRLAASGSSARVEEDLGGAISLHCLRVLELEAPGRHLCKLLDVIYAPGARVIELRSEAWAVAEELAQVMHSWGDVYGSGSTVSISGLGTTSGNGSGTGSSGYGQRNLAAQVWEALCTFSDRGVLLGRLNILNTLAVSRADWSSSTLEGARVSLITNNPRKPIKMRHIQAMLPEGKLDEVVTSAQIGCAPGYGTVMLSGADQERGWGGLATFNNLLSLSLAYEDGEVFLALMAIGSRAQANGMPLPKLQKLSLHGMAYSALATDLTSWIEDRTSDTGESSDRTSAAEFRELVITGYDDAEDMEADDEFGLPVDAGEVVKGLLTALLEEYIDAGSGGGEGKQRRRMKFVWEWEVVRQWNLE
jgi:hypothetical protein